MNILKATASLVKQTSTRAGGLWPWTLLLAVGLAPVAPAATRTPPNRMTVQSYITDDTGTPLGSSTAVNKKMVFVVYTADTGGAVVFADEQIVTVDNGHFSVVLGEGSEVSGQGHDLSTAFSGEDASDRFIEIQVSDTDGSNAQTLSPRLRLLPSAYAFLAAYANEAAKVTGSGVSTAAIADSAVNSAKIADNSLTAADLAPGSVTSSEIADNAVNSSHIVNDSIGWWDIAPNAVGQSELGANAVTSGHVADNSLTAADLAAGSVGSSEVADNSLTAIDLAANSVGTSELANNAVGSAQVADHSLNGNDIASFLNITDGIGVVHSAYSDVALTLQAQSSDNWLIYALNKGGSAVFRVDKSGYTYTATGLVTLSDRRMKSDIRPLEGVLDEVMKLEPSAYHLKNNPEGPEQIGFIAQDVQEVFPSAVVDGGDYLGLSYKDFGVLAIGAIKELNTKVENLEAENAMLSRRLARLEAVVQSLAR